MVNQLLLELYSQGAFGIPTITPNLTFNVSDLKLWAKFQLMPTSTRKANMIDDERNGILQVTLFVPIGTDDTLINAKAYAIAKYFDTQKTHIVLGRQVHIMSSHIETALPDSDGKWFMQPISIEYQVI